MKIVVDKLPENASDCLFAKIDNTAVGYGLWNSCRLTGSVYCHVNYGDQCPYLITKDCDNKSVI